MASSNAQANPRPPANRSTLLVVLLITAAVVAAGTQWLQRNSSNQTGSASLPPELQDEPDLYIDNAVIHQFRADGSRKYLLLAQRVSHFDRASPNENAGSGHNDGNEDSQLTRLERPDLKLTSTTGPPWHATANYGYVRQRPKLDGTLEEVVFLRENVELTQQRTPPAHLTVSGTAIYLYPDREFVESDESVTINSHTGRTTASSMRGNLATSVLQLRGDTTQVQTIVLPSQFK